ncbi:MAG TPA: sugar phosphate isomerase/epimerase family protein [Cytophagales bacterium]|nr:sugar phosphate isomerase/epimerase family protein [Cytophagales bacterium]
MLKNSNRRSFIKQAVFASASLSVFSSFAKPVLLPKKELFKISLGQWSLNRSIKSGKINSLDFPMIARKTYGVDAVEYVNQLFMDKAKDQNYLSELKKRADDNDVKNLLIMVDQEGDLGDPNEMKRQQSIENHYKWVDAAKSIGCHSIRVNAYSQGSYEDQLKYASDGLRKLTEFGAERGMNIIVENHGGMSSRGDWLAALMQNVNHPRCGTMPDFDNFQVSEGNRYDRYKGMKEIMPWAKSVSTKAHDFDKKGNETTIDFKKMFEIVLEAGYDGYVSAEYEGKRLSEEDGIKATIKLMEKVREELS